VIIANAGQLVARAAEPFGAVIARLVTIPGIGQRLAEVIVAETGGDMARFASSAKLAAWAGLAPGDKKSAGYGGDARWRERVCVSRCANRPWPRCYPTRTPLCTHLTFRSQEVTLSIAMARSHPFRGAAVSRCPRERCRIPGWPEVVNAARQAALFCPIAAPGRSSWPIADEERRQLHHAGRLEHKEESQERLADQRETAQGKPWYRQPTVGDAIRAAGQN